MKKIICLIIVSLGFFSSKSYSYTQTDLETDSILNLTLRPSNKYPEHFDIELCNKGIDPVSVPVIQDNKYSIYILDNRNNVLTHETHVKRQDVVLHDGDCIQSEVLPQLVLNKSLFPDGYYKFFVEYPSLNITTDTLHFYYSPRIPYSYLNEKRDTSIILDAIVYIANPDSIQFVIENNTDEYFIVNNDTGSLIPKLFIIDNQANEFDITLSVFDRQFVLPRRSKFSLSMNYKTIIKNTTKYTSGKIYFYWSMRNNKINTSTAFHMLLK